MTLPEAADILGITPDTLRQAIRQNARDRDAIRARFLDHYNRTGVWDEAMRVEFAALVTRANDLEARHSRVHYDVRMCAKEGW